MSIEMYEYDIAISYPSEDRSYAEALADILRNRGVHVFYDKYEKAVLWGQDLYTSTKINHATAFSLYQSTMQLRGFTEIS
jgi:hypothetical protein